MLTEKKWSWAEDAWISEGMTNASDSIVLLDAMGFHGSAWTHDEVRLTPHQVKL